MPLPVKVVQMSFSEPTVRSSRKVVPLAVHLVSPVPVQFALDVSPRLIPPPLLTIQIGIRRAGKKKVRANNTGYFIDLLESAHNPN